jgi:hypothetical protein
MGADDLIVSTGTIKRRVLTGLVGALSLGLLVGLLGGEPQRVSVELWIAVAAAWFAWLLIGQLTSVAPLRPDRFDLSLGRRREPAPLDDRARRLANLEGLIANAAHSQRAAMIRLRPQLVAVTDELLLSRHGIDRAFDRDESARILGDVAWIVDPDHDMVRSPTAAEVELLLIRAWGVSDGDGGTPTPDEWPMEVDR